MLTYLLMKVSILQPKGYCAGVARAINIALQARKEHPELDVSVLGMLVHNHHVSKLLNEYRFNDYVTLIKNFSMQYVIKDIPSNDNILTFIKVIFPIMPYLAEEVYENKFKSRYSIINEGWNE